MAIIRRDTLERKTLVFQSWVCILAQARTKADDNLLNLWFVICEVTLESEVGHKYRNELAPLLTSTSPLYSNNRKGIRGPGQGLVPRSPTQACGCLPTFPFLEGVQSTHAVTRSSRLILWGKAALEISNYPLSCLLVYFIIRTERSFLCLFLRNHLLYINSVFSLHPALRPG